jgi:hypothetical protein
MITFRQLPWDAGKISHPGLAWGVQVPIGEQRAVTISRRECNYPAATVRQSK